MADITVEELRKGFPTWKMLTDKNKIDLIYHVNRSPDQLDTTDFDD